MDLKQIQRAANIGSEVIATLINGSERSGILCSINNEYIELQTDEKIIPIMNNMIGVLEIRPSQANTIPSLKTKENRVDVSLNNNSTVSNESGVLISSVILTKIISIEANFNAGITNSDLSIIPLDFTTPIEISKTNQGMLSSEEQNIWNWIKQKHDNNTRNGNFNPKDEDLRVLIDKTQLLVLKYPRCSVFYSYLGYFHYLRNQKNESIKAYQKAAYFSTTGVDWLNLAAIGIKWSEQELTCYSLEHFFIQSQLSEKMKAWLMFTKLTIELNAYFSFFAILDSEKRFLFKDDLQIIFDTICYCLLKNTRKDIVVKLLESKTDNSDHKVLIIEGLKFLPSELSPMYKSLRFEFNKQIFSSSQTIAPTSYVPSQTQKTALFDKKPIESNGEYYMLREARQSRDKKDYTKAEELFRLVIKSKNIIDKDKVTGTRDLATMIDGLKRTEEAIMLISNQKSLDESDYQLLKSFNFRLGNFEKALQIEKQILKKTPYYSKDKKTFSYIYIGNCYLRLEKFTLAEENYRSALVIQTTNYSIKRNIAICLFKQGKIDEAASLLNEIIKEYNDPKSEQLLIAIQTPNVAKSISDIEEIIISTTLGVNPIDLDKFTLYYLNQSKLDNVPPERIKENKYEATNAKDRKYDLNKLEETATTLGTKTPEARSNVYLSAARIIIDSDTNERKLYRYLCRCFTSKGDDAVYKRRSIDTIKTFYLQALKVFDSFVIDEEEEQKQNFDEQDAVNALYRYLYAQLGVNEIPVAAKYVGSIDNQLKQIQDSCDDVFDKCFKVYGNYNKFFDAINLSLSYCPQYVAKRLLKVIFENKLYKFESLKYLHQKLNQEIAFDQTFENYVSLWRSLTYATANSENDIHSQIRILNKFEMSTIWLENTKNKVLQIIDKTIYETDNDYLRRLIKIFDTSLSLCNSNQYDEKISLQYENEEEVKTLLIDIEKNPTKLSIEEIIPILKSVQLALKQYLHNLNDTTRPDIEIDIPYISSLIGNKIEVQVKIFNKAEGPAEYVELIIEKDNSNYTLENYYISYGTIRGGLQDIRIVPIYLTQETINKNAFSMNVYACYKTKQGELESTEKELLSIEIPNPTDFKEINPNPFSTYAIGGEVRDTRMFYGRKEFIAKAYKAICHNYKSYVIFGQKRAGKSTILYHLEQKLKENTNIITANIGNIGSLYNPYSTTPFLYSILFDILQKIGYGIEDKEYADFSKLSFSIPSDMEFYNHPNPIQYFKNTLENFKRITQRASDWKDMRIIVLIDEFTYIYTFIIGGKIEDSNGNTIDVKAGTVDNSFMMNWKSLLQANYFSVALVAQDFFPKFKQTFPNEFQTMDFERVSYLDEIDSKLLIDEPIRIGGKDGESRYREKAIERIYKLTAGSPFYIQIFCDRLVEYINKEKQLITEANVNAVKEKLIRGDKRLDKTLFDNLINDGDTSPDTISNTDLEKVLRILAENSKNSEYGNLSNQIQTLKPLKEVIDNLINREVIEQNNNTYRIRVGLFKEWLNANT